jgi:hypothetical protein
MGRTTRRKSPPQLFAVKARMLRPIASIAALKRDEVAVSITHRPASFVKWYMPLPRPSDLAFEVWRLKTQARLSYGQIVTTSAVAKFVAPGTMAKAQHASRLTIAKNYVKDVTAFLATPIGLEGQTSESWREWLETGHDPNLLRLVPFAGYDPAEDFENNYKNFVLDRPPVKPRR